MRKQIVLRILPFVILCILTIATWRGLLAGGYIATTKHISALVLIIINLVAYFLSLRISVLFTGVILLLATFNILAFSVVVSSSSFFITFGGRELETPYIQPRSLFLFTLFLLLNLKYLLGAFSGAKGDNNQQQINLDDR